MRSGESLGPSVGRIVHSGWWACARVAPWPKVGTESKDRSPGHVAAIRFSTMMIKVDPEGRRLDTAQTGSSLLLASCRVAIPHDKEHKRQ